MDIKNNRLILVIIGVAIGIAGTILFSPQKIAKLSDGSGEVVSVGNISVSANEYYSLLKDEDRLNTLLRYINTRLIKDKYPNRENEAKEYAEQQYSTFKQQIELYNVAEEDALAQYGYKDKDDFIKYTSEDYYMETYYNDTMKSRVNVDEIKEQYDKTYFPTKHIYVFSSDNKNTLNKIKKQLDKGTNVNKVLSSNPSITYNDFDFTFYMTSYGEDMLNTVKETKTGKTSSIANDSIFGQYFIYVQTEGTTQTFDEVKDEMIEEAVYNLEAEDENIAYKVMLDLQKDNNIDFKDEKLKEAYEEYKKEFYK